MTTDPPRSVPRSRAWQRACATGLSALFAACAPAASPKATVGPEAQSPLQRDVEATMQRGVLALATLLPMAVQPELWQSPAEVNDARRAVVALRAAAVQLDSHPRGPDVSFVFLSRSLALEALDLRRDIEQSRYPLASERILRMAETCMACHARLPGADREQVAQALTARVDLGALPPMARATLQAATRQFNAALQTYEGQFADRSTSGAALELSSAVPSYLILVLRVKRDPERAERGLAMLATRNDFSTRFQRDVEAWRGAVVALAPELRATPSLAGARRILEQGRALNDFPWEDFDTVHEIVASSTLYRYLEESRPKGEDLAEALYLLARSEAFLLRSFELGEPQRYLEQAIRIAPHSDVAARAYAALEIAVALSYRPDSLPDEIREWLERLRELSSPLSLRPSAGRLSAP